LLIFASVIILYVIIQNVIIPSVIFLKAIILNAVILSIGLTVARFGCMQLGTTPPTVVGWFQATCSLAARHLAAWHLAAML